VTVFLRRFARMKAEHRHDAAQGGSLDVPESKGRVGRDIPISRLWSRPLANW
jgi:hypothetical protein